MMNKTQNALNHLNGRLGYHQRQIVHFEHEIERFQEAVDKPQTPQTAMQAQALIESMRGHIVSHQATVASIEEEIASM